MGRCGRGRKGGAGPSAHVPARGLPGGGSGSVDLLGAMAAGGLSRSERKAAERVRRLREEQQRERLRQVCHLLPRPASPPRVALTTCPAPAGVAHPEEGGGRAQRRGGPAPGRERGPGDRVAGPEQAARGPEAAAGGGESRAAPGSAGLSPGRGRGLRAVWVSRQVCDDPEELRRKVRELAGAVRSAKYLVVYTGAGISTVGRRGVTTAVRPGRLPGPDESRTTGRGAGGDAPGAPPSGRVTQGLRKTTDSQKSSL